MTVTTCVLGQEQTVTTCVLGQEQTVTTCVLGQEQTVTTCVGYDCNYLCIETGTMLS